ncbi:hypothetical protein K2Q16_00750 [Patescibacteria group bacterium]|nr:hypothetical protein [Patescibacteria group bacterium]
MIKILRSLSFLALLAFGFGLGNPASANCNPCFDGGTTTGTTTTPSWNTTSFGITGLSFGQSAGVGLGEIRSGTGTTYSGTEGLSFGTVTGGVAGTTNFCPSGSCAGLTGDVTARFGAQQNSNAGAFATSPTLSHAQGGTNTMALGGATMSILRGQ